MIINFRSNYNFEILSFLNILTGDEFYVKHHNEAYQYFSERISEKSRGNIQILVESMQQTNIAFAYNLIFAARKNFRYNTIERAFQMDDEMENIFAVMKELPYLPEALLDILPMLMELVNEVVKDLEAIGFREYWQRNHLPSIEQKCRELDRLVNQHDVSKLIRSLKQEIPEEIDAYICTYHRPHGTKLSQEGDAMIVSDSYSDGTALMVIVHELFHPPYNYKKIANVIHKLSEREWMQAAFENQNSNCAYRQKEYFVEENIVEALGIYVVYVLGLEKKPYEYFKNHDFGSHVLSPYFFDYLTKETKSQNQSFEEYLTKFEKCLDSMYK